MARKTTAGKAKAAKPARKTTSKNSGLKEDAYAESFKRFVNGPTEHYVSTYRKFLPVNTLVKRIKGLLTHAPAATNKLETDGDVASWLELAIPEKKKLATILVDYIAQASFAWKIEHTTLPKAKKAAEAGDDKAEFWKAQVAQLETWRHQFETESESRPASLSKDAKDLMALDRLLDGKSSQPAASSNKRKAKTAKAADATKAKKTKAPKEPAGASKRYIEGSFIIKRSGTLSNAWQVHAPAGGSYRQTFKTLKEARAFAKVLEKKMADKESAEKKAAKAKPSAKTKSKQPAKKSTAKASTKKAPAKKAGRKTAKRKGT